jgi:hypothetical protein
VFGQDWVKAEARIVARDTDYTGDGSVVASHTFVADVVLPNEEILRATVNEPMIATDFWPPSIGDVVSVLVRSKDHKVKFDKDDDRISAKAFREAQKRAFGSAQQQPPGTAPTGYAATSQLPDAIADTLAQLGITPGAQPRVFSADPGQAEAVLAAFARFGGQPGEVVPTTEARLAQLDTLRERDLLTVEEYAEQRQRILDEI